MKRFEKVVNVITSIGASIVIFGAWQKITHQTYADLFLTIGLLVEAGIFLLYAFIPPSHDSVKTEQPLNKQIDSEKVNFSQITNIDNTEINEQIQQLNSTLSELNKSYSGMLSAMRGK